MMRVTVSLLLVPLLSVIGATATFRRGTHRYTVRGRFSIVLPRGRYHLSVDGCAQRGFYVVRHVMRGMHLAPRGCFYPA